MANHQPPWSPTAGEALVAPLTEVHQYPLSPETSSDEPGNSSFEEGDSGETHDSGFHTASDPDTTALDRGTATSEIFSVLTRYPEISMELVDWARGFIDHPELLSRPSTIVDAFPDHEKACAEFTRGVEAVCRVISDERLHVIIRYATELEQEWCEALTKGNEAVRYADFIDLVYSEAERVVEGQEGDSREAADVASIGEVFGYAAKEAESDGAGEAAMVKDDAMETKS